MIVTAKWTIAYKGQTYEGGQRFEMDKKDYDKFKNDVEVVKNTNPSPRVKKTKQVTTKKTK